jgi:2-C-methyl-D-erythritol 4-phosphate cytidylyltransferase
VSPPIDPAASSHLALILPAAGAGTRMGGPVRKPLIELLGVPILCHTLRAFAELRGLEQVIIVAHPTDLPVIRSGHWLQLKEYGATALVAGGATRRESVERGLDAVRPGIDIVLIHDAVRPFVSRESIEESVRVAARHGAAVVSMPLSDTVKRVREGVVTETVPREDLWGAQTPQTFRRQLIQEAYAAARREGVECTDDAQLVEQLGHPARVVRGSYDNVKITTPDQLPMAEALLRRRFV